MGAALRLTLQDLPDQRGRARERLLRPTLYLRDLEDVPTEGTVNRADHLVDLRRERRITERLLLLALAHSSQLATLVLRRIDRVLLRDGVPALAMSQRVLRLLRLCLVVGPNDPDIACLGLAEL